MQDPQDIEDTVTSEYLRLVGADTSKEVRSGLDVGEVLGLRVEVEGCRVQGLQDPTEQEEVLTS